MLFKDIFPARSLCMEMFFSTCFPPTCYTLSYDFISFEKWLFLKHVSWTHSILWHSTTVMMMRKRQCMLSTWTSAMSLILSSTTLSWQRTGAAFILLKQPGWTARPREWWWIQLASKHWWHSLGFIVWPSPGYYLHWWSGWGKCMCPQ